MTEPLVVIGNGMVAARFVEELSRRALGRYAVLVVGDEPRLAYNRVLLPSVLAREVTPTEIELKPAQWWHDRGVTLLYGNRASAIDPAIRRVRLDCDDTVPYTKLVLATGSRPIRLAVPGMDLPGVLTFHDLSDVVAIERAAGNGGKVVVIGGGLLGLEAAYGLAKSGVNITVVHLMDRLMERQLDAHAAEMLKHVIEASGIEVVLHAGTSRVLGAGRVEAVALADGRVIEADTVIVTIGTRPNAELAQAAGITVNRGIVVDDGLMTSVADTYAIGDCAEHRGTCHGLVAAGYEQAGVLAQRLAGEDVRYLGSILATNLKVSGIHVFSAGDFIGAPETEQVVLSDPGFGTYKKLVIADGRLVGAVLFGDIADGAWYVDLIRSGASIEACRDDLVFGSALVHVVTQSGIALGRQGNRLCRQI
jgi:nitrite reductase (NADH) large subunit